MRPPFSSLQGRGGAYALDRMNDNMLMTLMGRIPSRYALDIGRWS